MRVPEVNRRPPRSPRRPARRRRLPAASTEHARRPIEVQVEATDREIDALVYDLYALSPEEIAVVEAGAGAKR